MRKPKVFITRELFPEVLKKLEEYYEVEVWDRYQEPSYEILLEKAKTIDALVTLVSDNIDFFQGTETLLNSCNVVRPRRGHRETSPFKEFHHGLSVWIGDADRRPHSTPPGVAVKTLKGGL